MTGVGPARRWHPGIDASGTLASIVLAALYVVPVVLGVLAVVACRRSQRRLAGVDEREAARQRVLGRVWVVLTAVLFVLLVNRALDLQTGALNLARRTAYRQGWYFRRREYQAEMITAIVVATAVGLAMLALVLRRVLGRIVLVVTSVVMLTVFTVVRAISFHYVDHFLETGGRYGLNAVVEGTLLVFVVASTAVWLARERRIVAVASAPQAPGWSPTPEWVHSRAAVASARSSMDRASDYGSEG